MLLAGFHGIDSAQPALNAGSGSASARLAVDGSPAPLMGLDSIAATQAASKFETGAANQSLWASVIIMMEKMASDTLLQETKAAIGIAKSFSQMAASVG